MQIPAEIRLGQLLQLLRRKLGRRPFDSLQNLSPPTVIQRQIQHHTFIIVRITCRFDKSGRRGNIHQLLQGGALQQRQPLQITQHPHFHTVFFKPRQLAYRKLAQQTHQRAHLGQRSVPVLGRKRINRQIFYAQPTASQHRFVQRINTRPVAGAAVQAALLGPTPVSVHHHRNMPGHLIHRQMQAGLRLHIRHKLQIHHKSPKYTAIRQVNSTRFLIQYAYFPIISYNYSI